MTGTFPVKSILVFTLLLLCPAIVLSHPGKTDKRGGHRCWKDCAQWQLDYGEYHLHDKDFRPIRLVETGKASTAFAPSQSQETPAPATEPEHAVDDAGKGQTEKMTGDILHAGRSEATDAGDGIESLIECDLLIFALVILLHAPFSAIGRRRRTV